MLLVECLVVWVVWAEWVVWVAWECNLIFSSENSKNPNGSNTFGVFFCSHSKMYNQMYERCTKLFIKTHTSKTQNNISHYFKGSVC
jgi:hypothetical protein